MVFVYLMLRLHVPHVKNFAIFFMNDSWRSWVLASVVGTPGQPGQSERAGAGRCADLLRLLRAGLLPDLFPSVLAAQGGDAGDAGD